MPSIQRELAPLRIWVAAALSLAAQPASAGEGIVEINMTAASAGGVTATDTPGFPVTLDASGSYRLTGNLASADPNVHVIEIRAADVTLDLGGFEVAGPASCPAFPCTNAGSGRGVVAYGFDNVLVRNGRVRGAASFGIELFGEGQRVERVAVTGNASNGIQIFGVAQVSHCNAEGNGENGIFLLRGSVTDSIAARNRNAGIVMGGPGLIARNAVLSNGEAPGVDPGVMSGGDVSLLANTIANNNGGGFSITAASAYGQNVLVGNASPQKTGGVAMGGNVCDGVSC